MWERRGHCKAGSNAGSMRHPTPQNGKHVESWEAEGLKLSELPSRNQNRRLTHRAHYAARVGCEGDGEGGTSDFDIFLKICRIILSIGLANETGGSHLDVCFGALAAAYSPPAVDDDKWHSGDAFLSDIHHHLFNFNQALLRLQEFKCLTVRRCQPAN